jgi:cysteine-rich repeat protein
VLGSIEEAFACQMGWVNVITDPLGQLPPEYEFRTLDDEELLSLPISTTALCGNGVVEAPEECDDGNISNTDGCAEDCTVEPITEVVPVACSNSSNNSIMQHDMRLIVDPVDRVEAGSSFGVEVSGEAVISEFWLDAVQNVVVGGAPEIVVDTLSYKVSPRSGATGPGVFLGLGQPYADGTCSDSPTGPSCTTESDCGGSTCKAVLQVPISNSFSLCDSLNKGTQWASNGFCVTGDLRVPLETKTASFVADAAGSVLFGWEEGAPPIPPAAPTQSWIAAGVLTVESECYMGTENAGQTALVPLADTDLIELSILE